MAKKGYTLARRIIDHKARTETYIFKNGIGERFELTIRDGKYFESAKKIKHLKAVSNG